MARFIRALTCLSSSGFGIIDSWKMAVDNCGNDILKRSFKKGIASLISGGELKEAFSKTEEFSPKAIALISSGEKSGSIGSSLERVAIYYEKEYELVIKLLSTLMPICETLGVEVRFEFVG